MINLRAMIKLYEDQLLSRKSSHFVSEQENYLKMARMENSLMEKMIRIYSLTRRISRLIMPATLSYDEKLSIN
ncbi:MAG: hypothetical protein GQ546_07430 [Gammaproteobacteria bacterium]|nr:hypothetical protein [Gammaproteobacteria bacterium]